MDSARLEVYTYVYTAEGGTMARIAKVFRSGNSQAVRIPREFRLDAKELEIERKGDTLVLRPKRRSWKSLLESLTMFSSDFMEQGRMQPAEQRREEPFS
jgi:antitoxin VapB